MINSGSVANYNIGSLADLAGNDAGGLSGTMDQAWVNSPYNNDSNGFYGLPGTMNEYANAMGTYDSNDPYGESSQSLYANMFGDGATDTGGGYDSYDFQGSGAQGEGLGSEGSGTISSPGFADSISDFMHSRLGRLAATGLGFAVPGAAPVLGAMGLANTLYRGGQQGATQFGANTIGNMAMTGSFGPWGAVPGIFGYGLGNVAGQTSGQYGNQNSGFSSVGGGSGQAGGSLGDGLIGLGSLFGQYQSNKAGNNYTNSLAGMYGQNSPYAQQLRQNLQRQDAAAGRRTQYGPREVELQARLADAASRVAPTVMNGQQNDFNNKMRLAQMGMGLYKSGAFNGLTSMFSPSSPSGAPADTGFLNNINFGAPQGQDLGSSLSGIFGG